MLRLKYMKQRTTTANSLSRTKQYIIAISIVVMAFAVPIQLATRVDANQYQQRINALQQDLDQYQRNAVALSQQAQTLQVELEKLTNEKNAIQAQVNLSQAKYDKLVADIAATEKKIIDNQDALGETIADIYVNDDISAIEMLASSNNISEYLDKQEYRSSIQKQMTATIKEIRALKDQLDQQKKDVERVLADQKTQRDALAAKESEQQALVNQTRGEEAAYQGLVAQRQAEIKSVQAEQAAYFASLGGGGGVQVVAGDPGKGGYPAYLANNPLDSLVDPWGMYNRECVSYVAWRVHNTYGNMPYWGGIGNAWQWAFSGYSGGRWHTANSERFGIPSGTEPRVGSAAVMNKTGSNPYGHIAWVEQVMGDQIRISQYNWPNLGGSGWGHYSEMVVHKSFFPRYIYFSDW
jgi:surface antigen